MALPGTERIRQSLQRAFRALDAEGPSDRELLARFARQHDQEAFAVLVRRHGAVVLGLCRRFLGNIHDAEDAFQATFLVLARKAQMQDWQDSVAGWLFTVAYHCALRARTKVGRRRALETSVDDVNKLSFSPGNLATTDTLRVLDEELARLPDKYRAPLIACCLEGLTTDEAARQLECTPGAVRGKLERGRKLLRRRLERRGIAVSGAALSTLLAAAVAGPASAALMDGTVRAAIGFALDGAGNGTVMEIAGEVLQGMLVQKTKRLAALFLVVVLFGSGTLASLLFAAKPAEESAAAAPEVEKAPPPPALDNFGDPLPAGAIARLGTSRLRHSEFLWDLQFSPDGKTIATKDTNHHIHLWEVPSGKELRRFDCPYGTFSCGKVVFSPDGKWLASGDGNKDLRIWEVETGKLLRRFPDKGWLSALAFTPDGKSLVLGDYGDDHAIYLIDAVSGEVKRSFQGHTDRVTTVDLTRDGTTLASGSFDATVRLWDVASGKELASWKAPAEKQGVAVVAFAPDGKSLAVGYELGHTVAERKEPHGTIKVYDVGNQKEIRSYDGHTAAIYGISFSSDGKLVATSDWNLRIRLREAATGRTLHEFRGSGSSICSAVSFSPDGKILASRGADSDHLLTFWDTTTGKDINAHTAHEAAIAGLAVSANGAVVASLDHKRDKVWLWDTATGRRSRLISKPEGYGQASFSAVSLSPDGRSLAATRDKLYLWDVASGKDLQQFPAPKHEAYGPVCFAPDGKSLATVDRKGTIQVWNVESAKEKFAAVDAPTNGNHNSQVEITFSPDGRSLASGNAETDVVTLWDVATGKAVRRLSPPPMFVPPNTTYATTPMSLAFSTDGRHLAVGGGHFNLPCRIYDVATGRERLRFEEAAKLPATASALLPLAEKGTLLAWSSNHWSERSGEFWVTDGHRTSTIAGHRGRLTASVLSADGQRLVTGSADSTILVWDVARLPRLQRPARELSDESAEALWPDLESDDAWKANQAMDQLAASPKCALSVVRKYLKPVAVPDAKALERLVADLESPEFTVRTRAHEELEKLADLAHDALRKALEKKPSLEVRKQIDDLLEKFVGVELTVSQRTAWRACEILERINTPEAREQLKQLADGAPAARTTTEARAALDRLSAQR